MNDSDFDASREERLYDEYLDAALRGEIADPASFCESHEGSPEVQRWIEGVHKLLGESSGQTPEANDAVPFERLGDFRLLRRLGEGAMGRVYLAEQLSLGRYVALKVVRPELAASSLTQARFEREARAIAKLTHPHIIRIFGYGQDEGTSYIAMELLPGRSLQELAILPLDDDSRPSLKRFLTWMLQIARALQVSHEGNVLHRDVKPSNIRITENDEAVLVDFGLARGLESEEPTLTHSFAGSPSYASPEQISKDHGELDARSDVYSLGATMYEAVTGRVPFEGETLERLMHRVLVNDPIPASKIRPQLPNDVDVVLSKAMEKVPAHRYQTAGELADDLEAILTLRPIRAKRPRLHVRTTKWMRRNPVAAMALGAAGVVLVGIAVALLVQGEARKRAAAQEARSLVQDARTTLDEIEARHLRAEKASWAAVRLRTRSENEWLSPLEDRRLARSHGVVAINEQRRERDMARVLRLLSQAQRLDPSTPGTEEAWAAFYYQKWIDARAMGHGSEAEYRRDVLDHDPTGEWTKKMVGPATVDVHSEPSGAEVFLFRFEEQSALVEGGEHRLVPHTLGENQPALVRPGMIALRVVEDGDEVFVHDLVVRIAGHGIQDAMLVARGSGEVLKGDRLVAIDGEAVRSEHDFARLEYRPESSERNYAFSSMEDGEENLYELRGRSLEELGIEVLSPRRLVEGYEVEATLYRRGELIEIDIPAGTRTRSTAMPLFFPERSEGRTPLSLSLDTGRYMCVLVHEGFESVRVPFHVDHPTKPYRDDVHLHVSLPEGDVPEGFVYVASDAKHGPHGHHGETPFWMAEFEVTCGEYVDFLNDPQTLHRIRKEKDRICVPTYPSHDQPNRWRTRRGTYRVPDGLDDDMPVLGIRWYAAQAYVDWLNREKPVDGFRYSLPTALQWQRTLISEISRRFVYGDHYHPKWVKSFFSRRESHPEPVGSYPIDESPYGVFDMGGSASEWCLDAAYEDPAAHRLLVGGSWQHRMIGHFGVGNQHWYTPDAVLPAIGIRVVLNPN